ncbi:MAG TPA: molybdopterin molybdotransferase MoeA [Dokdonella sp.]|nr:molybdopterin molybdotransferase MoeA [Dokdonella sp.]
MSDFPVQLSVDDARERILAHCANRRLPAEAVDLGDAHGRVLSFDACAPGDLPPFANSAMDGFAVCSVDLPTSGERRLRLVGTRLAGDAAGASVMTGECLRITTGAPMPTGADTVVIKERVRVEGDSILLGAGEVAGSHVRPAGEDFRSAEVVVRAGLRITPPLLAALASLGEAHVEVARRPRVSVMTTGDELVLPGEPCAAAQIYNSNGYCLAAMLEADGCELVSASAPPASSSFRHLRDDAGLIRTALLEAAANSDVIVTSGGVSAGEADFLPDLVGEIGRVLFWKVRMRPGMPFLFGEIGRTLVFCLPGNPVSTMATYLGMVRPALAAIQGSCEPPLRLLSARLSVPLVKRHERTEFVRAVREPGADGVLHVRPTSHQGSAMLRGMVDADSLIIVPESTRTLEQGSIVQVLPIPELY